MVRFCLLLLAGLMVLSPAASAREEGIAAIVNQDAISMTDFIDRTKLIMVSSGLPDSPEIRDRLAPQIISSLIEEQLMIQEAGKRELIVSPAEIDAGFAALAQQNKIAPEQFKQMIGKSGINVATMQRQIKAQVGWGKVIQKVMRPQVTVTDADIDEYLARLNANKGKEEYLLAEILLPVETPSDDGNVRQLATKLVAEIRAGKVPFQRVAQQFSKTAGAAQGGDLGWMQQGQLQEELDAPLQTMQAGSISDPIRSTSGYHILALRAKRAITDESMPSRDEVTNVLGLQRLDRLQRRYLMDLKTAAFIENRVQS